MLKQLLGLGFIAVVGLAFADEKRVETRTLEKDGIQVTIGGNDGYTISVDGTPFSNASKLFVVDPAWKERYYGYNDDKERLDSAKTTTSVPGADGLVIPLVSSRSDAVAGTQTLELLPGRKLRVAVDIQMTSDTRGVLENRIASISEVWLSNREFSGVMKDGTTTSGRTPRWAPGTEPKTSTLFGDLKKTRFELPQGPLVIQATGDAEIALLDYRRNQWAEGQKYYWFGVLGSELPDRDVLSYEVTFTFPEKADIKSAATTAKGQIELLSTDSVYKVQSAEDRIIPTPKQVKWFDGTLPTGSEIGFALDSSSLPGSDAIVADYGKRLSKIYGITLMPLSAAEAKIIITRSKDVPGDHAWMQDEAYAINISDSQMAIDVKTTTGLLNALRTVEQLIRVGEDQKIGFRRCEIADFPSLPFRAIHFFTGKDARELQIKMISEILAPLKINNLIYQIDYTKWESLPQIHSELLGMDKVDVKAVGDSAERQGIDVIPLVNTFGHSEWLLQRPEMRYLADDPADPYAYDPSNPKVYEICEEIYREAIEMFSPTVMHIGHDEVSMDGFPKKPENKAIGATQLLINDTVHYYEFLKKQGIRTMIWGDMFLAPGEAPDATLADTVEEAARRRSLLPKDIMIADWHYKSAPVDEYKSLGIFNNAGFEAIACTWFAPDNIVRFAKAAAEQREETTQTLGLIQTTWAGYSFDEESLISSVEQYAAYVLAAEAAWTGGYKDSKDVPFDYQEVFLRRWNGEYLGGIARQGWMVNLDSVANVKVDPASLSLADDALSELNSGQMVLGNYSFQLPGKDGALAALRLAGAFDTQGLPNKVNLSLGGDAKDIYIAMATPSSVPDGTPVGSAVFTLEDGSRHSGDFRYGKNIMGIADGRQTLLAPIAWKSENTEIGQGGAAIHVFRWEMPVPGKVKSLELKSAEAGPGMLVFGISGAK